ncbi:MAG TPA: hypothetical protein VHT03_08105 [Rhizomicrobium sp.]|jgi:hypothetical protein|nr:hypothetical protein [Rhizomicrobium sp.]
MSDLDRALQYRFRAEELRVICASWLEEDARQMLERVADDYDRMATVLEHRGDDNPAIFAPGVDTRQ